jgi:hypothetical protein
VLSASSFELDPFKCLWNIFLKGLFKASIGLPKIAGRYIAIYVFLVFGGLQNRSLFYYKSVRIRDLFGNMEGGALPDPENP